jgi:hypothetical protein
MPNETPTKVVEKPIAETETQINKRTNDLARQYDTILPGDRRREDLAGKL